MKLKNIFCYPILVFVMLSCGEQSNDAKPNLKEALEPVELLIANLENDNQQEISIVIDEMYCYGRNRMEVELLDLGKSIQAQIHYRKDHDYIFRDSLVEKTPELLKKSKESWKDEYNKIIIDTNVLFDKQELLTELAHCKGLDNNATVAGSSTKIQISIDGKKTEHTAYNTRLLGLLRYIATPKETTDTTSTRPM